MADDIQSKIRYSPYSALLVHQRCEEIEAASGGTYRHLSPFLRPGAAIAGACQAYKNTLVEYAELYSKVSNVPSTCPDHLFQPSTFVTFGDTDCLSMIAIDDFDILTELSLHHYLQIHQSCVAFCLDAESTTLPSLQNSVFCNFDRMVSPKEDLPPLVLLSHFRMNGLAVLGPGLMLSQALFSAIALKVTKTLEDLASISISESKRTSDFQISDRDLREFHCSFLDPQGWSDLALVFRCRNMSIAASVLMAIRAITFRDLYQAAESDGYGSEFSMYVESESVHTAFAHVVNAVHKDRTNWEQVPKTLDNNHVFCATLSLAGISEAGFEVSDREVAKNLYSGIVYGDSRFNTPPGHIQELGTTIQTGKAFWDDVSKTSFPSKEMDSSWLILGHNDFNDRILCDQQNFQGFPLFDLLERIKNLRPAAGAECPPSQEWPIRDLVTELYVPYLFDQAEFASGQTRANTHCNVTPLLEEMVTQVFFRDEDSFLSYKKLRTTIEKLRIPVPVSNSILYSFLEFSDALRNPFYFDHVIDLLDVFRTVYDLLTEDLIHELDHYTTTKYARVGASSFLNDHDIEKINGLARLLRDSLSLRTKPDFRSAGLSQSAVDFKAGLTKLIHSVDVPLKCGGGLLRRLLRLHNSHQNPQKLNAGPPGTKSRIQDAIRSRVGGTCLVTSTPRASAHWYKLGQNRHYLIGTNFNISGLVRPETHFILLHELAHFVEDLLPNFTKPPLKPLEAHFWDDLNTGDVYQDSAATLSSKVFHPRLAEKERYEEVFADSFVFALFYCNKKDVYLKKHFSLYALDPKSLHNNPNYTAACATEVLLRMFLVTDPYIQNWNEEGPIQLAPRYTSKLHFTSNQPELSNVIDEFCRMVDSVSIYFYEFHKLWNRTSVKREIVKNFAREYVSFYNQTREICKHIFSISRSMFLGEAEAERDPLWFLPKEDTDSDLESTIEKAFAAKAPVLRPPLSHSPDETDAPETSNARKGLPVDSDGYIDMLYFVNQLYRHYDEWLYDSESFDPEKALWIVRDLNTGKWTREGITTGVNPQMLDRTFNGFVSADFSRRADYMSSRICHIKSVWGISTSLRARRFLDLLNAAFDLN